MIEVPRDADASFDPQIVKMRQRRLTGVDEIVLSLSVKGLAIGEIAAHFPDVYGASVSIDTISRITAAQWPTGGLTPAATAQRQNDATLSSHGCACS